MGWRTLGLIYCPDGSVDWMRTHASNPVADHLQGDEYRIYFSTRDASNRSSIAWLDIDLKDPCRVLDVARTPVLSPGDTGSFDDSGCSMGCVVRDGEDRWIYYMGWNLGVTVPWRNSIGLAVSSRGQPFRRVSRAPVMDRSEEDPFTLSYPWVLRDASGWRMWYGSNLSWGASGHDMHHMIKSARSTDGVVWRSDGHVVVAPEGPGEYAFARPCVVRDGGLHRMWYAWRGDRYRIGYAESTDGETWTRSDERLGLDRGADAWNGESVCYPSVFDHAGRRYMLYCGNGYGRTGFGIASLE